jgi:hypothetical protein
MMGPINGEISMAPITTAVEFTLSPMAAMKTLKIKIHKCESAKVYILFDSFNSGLGIGHVYDREPIR